MADALAGTMVLVANDPVSGWLWVHKTAPSRDGATWQAAVDKGLQGMRITLHGVSTDGAPGLIYLALTALKVSWFAELFHGQYELTRACHRGLALRVETAQTAHQEQVEVTQAVRSQLRARARGERRPGRPADLDRHLAEAEAAQNESAATLRRARADQETMREVVRGLSEALHPVDLATGEVRQGPEVTHALETLVARARLVGERLGDRASKAVEKVQRWVPSWSAMVPAWWARVRTRVEAEGLSPALTLVLLQVLIPAMYVAAVAQRNHLPAEARKTLRGVQERLLSKVRGDAAWQRLGRPARAQLLALSEECAGWFVRSTGSTEGHNGWLRQRFQALHRVTDAWLETQQVLHNFYLRRPDGTTAAERFFGTAPPDLVEHLVRTMPLPALPRRRKTAGTDRLTTLNL
ncbi:MAG: hypothetical protein HY909_15105 [Deltaproteobacteria bacterium]|nr:hypothetical protein [Deltaproteobacteria bacterium]